MPNTTEYVRPLDTLRSSDVAEVGGKNASLGEMIAELAERGIRVPGGFATTAAAYRHFLEHNELSGPLADALSALSDGAAVEDVGRRVRELIIAGEWPENVARQIRDAYDELSTRYEREALDVAVRSSATAEDLPDASFAGQQDTFLGVVGEDALRNAIETALTLSSAAVLEPDDFTRPATVRETAFELPLGGVDLDLVERDLLRQALERTGGNRTRAAALLGLTRDTMRYRMKKHGLDGS
jgi:DNA-binding NtrC family response regulator